MSVHRGDPPPRRAPSLVERVQRARAIAAERTKTNSRGKLAPKPWPAIGKQFGISERQARRIYEDFCHTEQDEHDPLAVIGEAIALRTEARDHLASLAVEGDNVCAQIGATRAMVEMDDARLTFMQAAGRMPRNLVRYRADADFKVIVDEMPDVMARNGVAREVLEQMHDVVRRHRPDSRNGTPSASYDPQRAAGVDARLA